MYKHYFSRRRRASRRKVKRVGNKVELGRNRGKKSRILKVHKDKATGREYFVSGKSRTKTWINKSGMVLKAPKRSMRKRKSRGRSSRKRRRSSRKRRGRSSRKRRRSSRKRRRSSRKRRRSSRKKFGRQPGLVNMMGNYRPPNQMNTFQQYTGMPGPQMARHMAGISKADRANFYTGVN